VELPVRFAGPAGASGPAWSVARMREKRKSRMPGQRKRAWHGASSAPCYPGQDSRGRRFKHRAEAEFSGAEARPVSWAYGSVCGDCWSADLGFVAQQRALLIDDARLLIELVGHRPKNRAGALVVLAVGEIATMFGMEPKLLCGAAH
jgi:hypothetical protein